MRRIYPILCCLCAGLFACGDRAVDPPPSATVPPGYTLVWHDEFDYTGLPDSTKWGYQTGGHGWTSKELQYYQRADPDNVRVADGRLQLTARVEKVARNAYTSTRLVSKAKGEFEYGYVEVRARPAAGAGLRSAFWLVGANVGTKGWPMAGEINVLDHYGSLPDLNSSSVQTPDNNWFRKSQLGNSYRADDLESDFHTYAVDWSDERLLFYVDGQQTFEYVPKLGRGEQAYPFTWPFYLIASLSVGGERGPGGQVNNAALPATMEIDYVRVYQRD